MKKRIIIVAGCLVIALALCLTVALIPEPEITIPGLNITLRPTTKPTEPAPTEPTEPAPEVRIYLADNQKEDVMRQIAQAYTEATGVKVIVTQAAENATIVGMTDALAMSHWEDRLYDLTGTAVLSKLYSQEFAINSQGKAVAIAMDVTVYGLIYNSQLLAQAFGTRTDLESFLDLKVAVEHITSEKNSNGFHAFTTGDFSSTTFAALLAGMSRDPAEIRSFVDLYMQNDTASGVALNNFLSGKSVFYVGGAWEYDQISSLGIHNLDILPLYTAGGGSFPCICSYYWGVNAQVAQRDLQVSLDFLDWLVTAGENGTAPVDGLGFFAPFRDAKASPNAFYRLVRRYLAEEPVQVMWSITPDLSEQDLATLAQALVDYNKNPTDENWAAVAAILTGTEETET